MHGVLRLLTVGVFLVAVCSVAGCANTSTLLPDPHLEIPADAKRVVFSEEFGFEWQRVFVFPPYRSRDDVESALGFSWPEYEESTIGTSESICLVVFVSDGSVVGWYEQPRDVDLAELAAPQGYSRDDALFEVTRGVALMGASDGVLLHK